MNRIHTLDGLRGIAILMVVAGHALTNYPDLSAELQRWLVCFANPGMGVRLFFALSGYLITELLLRETESRGSVGLTAFYGRRARRILPAFYVFLGCVALWTLLVPAAGNIPGSAWLASGTFTWNYSFFVTDHGHANLWNLGHTWSLAVEAQFYLLWPALLIWLGPRRALIGALVLLALGPAIRVGSYIAFPAQRGYLGMMLHTGFDGILAGCASALLARRAAPLAFLRRHCTTGVMLAFTWILVLGPICLHEIRGFPIVAGFTVDAIAAAWLVAGLHLCPPVWATRVIGSGALPAIGVISYSLYLWQQIFLGPRAWIAEGRVLSPLVAAVAVACASYWLVERPFLRKRPGAPVPKPALNPQATA